MSIKSQQANMKTISKLLQQSLGYIAGEGECGPNGAKKEFMIKSAAFLRALGKDLRFAETRVRTNPAGIAVSGEVTLMGMWDDGNGLYFQLSQPVCPPQAFLYREIRHMKDCCGGQNKWLPCGWFAGADYGRLVTELMKLRKTTGKFMETAA